jgi:hypothetical protein
MIRIRHCVAGLLIAVLVGGVAGCMSTRTPAATMSGTGLGEGDALDQESRQPDRGVPFGRDIWIHARMVDGISLVEVLATSRWAPDHTFPLSATSAVFSYAYYDPISGRPTSTYGPDPQIHLENLWMVEGVLNAIPPVNVPPSQLRSYETCTGDIYQRMFIRFRAANTDATVATVSAVQGNGCAYAIELIGGRRFVLDVDPRALVLNTIILDMSWDWPRVY